MQLELLYGPPELIVVAAPKNVLLFWVLFELVPAPVPKATVLVPSDNEL